MKRTAAGRLPRLLLWTGLASIAMHWALRLLLPAPGLGEERLLGAVLPEAFFFSEKGGSPPHYRGLTPAEGKEAATVGVAVVSSEVGGETRGFAGPVPLLVGVDLEGRITAVRLLGHRETPSYAAAVESPHFLDQFAGRSAADRLRLDEDLDGVTRATVTAAAVAEGVRRSLRRASGDLLGLAVPDPADEAFHPPWGELLALGGLSLLAVVSLVLPLPLLRWSCLAASLAVLGLWQALYLSASTAVSLLMAQFPSPREHLLWYALVVFALGSALLWRNVYCARLCPFGALQEFLHRLVPLRLRAGAGEEREARALRYCFLWLVTLAVFLFDLPAAAGFEPFGTAFDFKGGTLRWSFLALVLALASVHRRFWCRYFCPTGLWLQLLGRMRTALPFEEGAPTPPPRGD